MTDKKQTHKVEPLNVATWGRRFPYTPPPHVKRGASEHYHGPSKKTLGKRSAKGKD